MKEQIVIFHHDCEGRVNHWSLVGEIVRCKDCKWAKPTTTWKDGMPYVPDGKYICTVEGIGYGLRYRVDADFCSLAERREE